MKIKFNLLSQLLLVFFFSLLSIVIFNFTHNSQSSDSNNYLVRSQRGNIPIIITAPHGGKPSTTIQGIKLRKGEGIKQFNDRWDINTADITIAVAQNLETKYNQKPYLVIAQFNRKYIDANRPPELAYENILAKPYYDAYHQTIETFIDEMQQQYKQVLLIDIHGQSSKPSVIWRGTRNGKSVSRLIDKYGWKSIVGQNSIFGVLKQKGYPLYPERIEDSERPYNGGYTTKKYRLRSDLNLNAIQIEIGSDYRQSQSAINKLARDLSEAIVIFQQTYLQ